MLARREELDALIHGACALGVLLNGNEASKLIDFLDVLYVWNRACGLTNIARTDAVRIHLLDSLSVSPLLTLGALADLGTGGGLPGLPLAVVRPDINFYLVESSRRRCSFLFEAVRKLGLSNAFVLETDVENLIAAGRRFDTVLSRAFRSPAEFLDIASRLLLVGGRAIVMKGGSKDPTGSFSSGTGAVLELEFERQLKLPQGGESRSLVVLRRVA